MIVENVSLFKTDSYGFVICANTVPRPIYCNLSNGRVVFFWCTVSVYSVCGIL